MYGSYRIPFEIEEDDIKISVKKENGNIIYTRNANGETEERIISTNNAKILINPIEPVNTPKEITSNIEIEFGKKIIIEPRTTKKIYLTFPIEIGVFVMGGRSTENIDVFTLSKQKFTLYGSVRSGITCKYWKSDVHDSIPETHMNREGVMELYVINPTHRWAEVSRSVFNAHGMKIYYDDKKVMMKARIKVISKGVAETDFFEGPPENNMKKSLEMYAARKLLVLTSKFLMGEGL